MRQIGSLCTALVVGLVLAAPVHAQGFRGGLAGSYMLLRNKSVQEELKLSEEQSEKVTKIVEEAGAKMREKFEAIPEDERREKGPEVFRAVNDEIKAAAKDVIGAEKLTRLDQIILQQQGIQAFVSAKVQEKLKLTDDQKSKIKEIADDTQSKRQELFAGFADDREGTMQKLIALRKESSEKAAALLTDDQKKSWKELTGKPFEVKFVPPPGA